MHSHEWISALILLLLFPHLISHIVILVIFQIPRSVSASVLELLHWSVAKYCFCIDYSLGALWAAHGWDCTLHAHSFGQRILFHNNLVNKFKALSSPKQWLGSMTMWSMITNNWNFHHSTCTFNLMWFVYLQLKPYVSHCPREVKTTEAADSATQNS